MNEFEEYVKRYAEGRGISVEVALTHKVVKDAQKYYQEKNMIEGLIRKEAEELCSDGRV